MRTCLTLLLICTVGGCAPNPRITRLDAVMRPPRDARHVEIFAHEPSRSYVVIALWEAEEQSPFGTDPKPLQKKAIQRAAALGADAVILSVREEAGLPVRLPSLTPGVASEGPETTVFTGVTQVRARFIVWR
jgi:hypothetical protein